MSERLRVAHRKSLSTKKRTSSEDQLGWEYVRLTWMNPFIYHRNTTWPTPTVSVGVSTASSYIGIWGFRKIEYKYFLPTTGGWTSDSEIQTSYLNWNSGIDGMSWDVKFGWWIWRCWCWWVPKYRNHWFVKRQVWPVVSRDNQGLFSCEGGNFDFVGEVGNDGDDITTSKGSERLEMLMDEVLATSILTCDSSITLDWLLQGSKLVG